VAEEAIGVPADDDFLAADGVTLSPALSPALSLKAEGDEHGKPQRPTH
jgi:hypothetical protein